ncbi:MAG TPA: SLBB domain-containing protein, partial [Candidatus Ozemobacteraceae bacterium]|nr:SLBB domain-containing protein [Candidatus Ozemobacteraceae bacterium]
MKRLLIAITILTLTAPMLAAQTTAAQQQLLLQGLSKSSLTGAGANSGSRISPTTTKSLEEAALFDKRLEMLTREQSGTPGTPEQEKANLESRLRELDNKVQYLEQALRRKIIDEMVLEKLEKLQGEESKPKQRFDERLEEEKARLTSAPGFTEAELDRRVKEFIGEYETEQEANKPFGSVFFERSADDIAQLENVPVPSTYILGPGDSLKIIVWSEMGDETVYDVTVNPEGQVYIPIIGLFGVQGQTVGQFEEVVLGKLAEKFKHFKGQVTLSKIRTLQIFVVGEVQKPGSMIVSALSTALHALVRAGGPSDKGTMRNIKVWRQNQVVAEIDLYKYFMHGDKSQDILLESGDTLFVGPVGSRVFVKGQVIRPATYELAGENTLSEVLTMAGGVAPGAYTRRVKIFRWQGNERRQIMDSEFASAKPEAFVVQNGDEVFVDKAIEDFGNEVTIEGPVQKPGSYAVTEGTTIRELIKRAGGVIPEKIAKNAGQIIRKLAGGKEQLLAFKLEAAVNGDAKHNLTVQPLDKVVLFSFDEVEPNVRKVVIAGAVRRPGEYIWREGMTVRDLVLRAQGLTTDAATDAEIARMSGKENTQLQNISMEKIFENPADVNNVVLQPLDRVNILARGGEIIEAEVVYLKGEVVRPGPYAIKHRGETLTDLIKRAGGLTKRAFAEGTIFTRQTANLVAEQQLQIAEEVQGDLYKMASNDLKADLMRAGARFSEVTSDKTDAQVLGATSTAGLLGGIGQGDFAEAEMRVQQAQQAQTKKESSSYSTFDSTGRTLMNKAARIPIRLDLAIRKPQGDEDLELMDGDEIVIPPVPTTVSVVGAVVNPTNILFKDGKTVR